MIPKDLFQKIRRIEITTSRLVTDVFAGQYHSAFKGQGIEFNEVRQYLPGDDVRLIDWNVTARTATAHIKKYVEERELTVMLLVDASMSCHFASVNQLKNKLAAQIAAVLAFAAIRNNDKVGLIVFTDRIEKYIAPRKGARHVLRVIREMLYMAPQGRATNISQALNYLNKVTHRKTIAFVISDFLESAPFHAGLRKTLAVANRRHDVVAVTLNDPREVELPDCGLLQLEDAETLEQFTIDTSSFSVRRQYRDLAAARINERNHMFGSAAVDHIDISTDKPFAQEMAQFFLKRRHRRGL